MGGGRAYLYQEAEGKPPGGHTSRDCYKRKQRCHHAGPRQALGRWASPEMRPAIYGEDTGVGRLNLPEVPRPGRPKHRHVTPGPARPRAHLWIQALGGWALGALHGWWRSWASGLPGLWLVGAWPGPHSPLVLHTRPRAGGDECPVERGGRAGAAGRSQGSGVSGQGPHHRCQGVREWLRHGQNVSRLLRRQQRPWALAGHRDPEGPALGEGVGPLEP